MKKHACKYCGLDLVEAMATALYLAAGCYASSPDPFCCPDGREHHFAAVESQQDDPFTRDENNSG